MGGNQTLAHYDLHAATYDAAFAAHDTSDAIARLMAALNRSAPAVLELGCGNGRDLLALRQAGAKAEGVEGAQALARIATRHTGLPIHHFDLLSPGKPPWQGQQFDALYAHHILFHIPSPALPWMLWRARGWLVPDGLFYVCDATGDGLEGTMPDGRHIALRRPQTIYRLMRDAGFDKVEEWRRPIGAPRKQQGWLASIWRKDGE